MTDTSNEDESMSQQTPSPRRMRLVTNPDSNSLDIVIEIGQDAITTQAFLDARTDIAVEIAEKLAENGSLNFVTAEPSPPPAIQSDSSKHIYAYGHKHLAYLRSLPPLHVRCPRKKPPTSADSNSPPDNAVSPSDIQEEAEFRTLVCMILIYLNGTAKAPVSDNVALLRGRILTAMCDQAAKKIKPTVWLDHLAKKALPEEKDSHDEEDNDTAPWGVKHVYQIDLENIDAKLDALFSRFFDTVALTKQFTIEGFYELSPRGSIYQQLWNAELRSLAHSICIFVSGSTLDGAHLRRLQKVRDHINDHDGSHLMPDSEVYEEVRSESGAFSLRSKQPTMRKRPA